MKTYDEICNKLNSIKITQNNQVIFARDFNSFLYSKLESNSENPVPKSPSIRKFFELRETYHLSYISRIRNSENQIIHI